VVVVSYGVDIDALKRRALVYAKMAVQVDREDGQPMNAESAYAVGFVSGYLASVDDVNAMDARTVRTQKPNSVLRAAQLRSARAARGKR
jgi:hypothetical protein